MKFILLIVFSTVLIVNLTNFSLLPETESVDEEAVILRKIVVDDIYVDTISAKAYGVFDVKTGELLISKNEDEVLPIASVTKLFTAASVLEDENESLIVTASDVTAEGRSGKLEEGQEYKIQELLFPLLLESSNDAAVALNRALDNIPYSDFADASGLSAQNKLSVSELADSIKDLYEKTPRIFDITKIKQYIGEYSGWVNNSPVRNMDGYQGGKHGYTNEAGRTLVAIFSEPNLEGRELGYILLGSDNVKNDVILLRKQVADSVHLE